MHRFLLSIRNPSCKNSTNPPPLNPPRSGNGLPNAHSMCPKTLPNPNSTASPCSPIPAASCTWGMCATTPSATCAAASKKCRGSTCCSRWVGTRSACPPKTRRLTTRSRRPNGRMKTLPICASSCRAWALRWIGSAKSPPAAPNTTAGSSSCLPSCLKKALCTRSWAR